MTFISISAHQKFISLCNSLIEDNSHDADLSVKDEKEEQLKQDLDKLHQLAQKYKTTFSELPKISQEYNILQRNIRINIRKLRIKKKNES